MGATVKAFPYGSKFAFDWMVPNRRINGLEG
jgi:hypothetical protein